MGGSRELGRALRGRGNPISPAYREGVPRAIRPPSAPSAALLHSLDLQAVDRRAALGLLAAAAAVSTAQPSEAAYGDAARVFAGTITNKSGECTGLCALQGKVVTCRRPIE